MSLPMQPVPGWVGRHESVMLHHGHRRQAATEHALGRIPATCPRASMPGADGVDSMPDPRIASRCSEEGPLQRQPFEEGWRIGWPPRGQMFIAHLLYRDREQTLRAYLFAFAAGCCEMPLAHPQSFLFGYCTGRSGQHGQRIPPTARASDGR